MVGVIAQPFVTSAPFPFELLFAMYDLLSVKSDFCPLDRHRCGFCGCPAGVSIKRSSPAPAGHRASVFPDWRCEQRGSHATRVMVGSVRCEGERLVPPKLRNSPW